MKASFTLAAALVGALALPVLANGPAHAGAGPDQLHSSTSLLTLVAEGSGGGPSSGGGGNSSGGGGGQAASGGPASGGHSHGSPNGHVATGHDNGGPTGRQGMANNRGDDRHSMRDHDRDHGRTATRDNDNHDNDRHDRRHGHFVNGVWVWYGAPYASNDCGWIKHRAIVTGSPYWWSRYHECAY
jgi:hypothetical protein